MRLPGHGRQQMSYEECRAQLEHRERGAANTQPDEGAKECGNDEKRCDLVNDARSIFGGRHHAVVAFRGLGRETGEPIDRSREILIGVALLDTTLPESLEQCRVVVGEVPGTSRPTYLGHTS